MSNDVVAIERKPSLLRRFGERFGIDPNRVLDTLKATAFRGNVSNEQMVALLVVADQYRLNPFTREIYAFPDRQNGIVPVIGVDGWSRIINEHPQFDGMDYRAAEKLTAIGKSKPCPEWIECVIYRKDRSHPTVAREYLDEVYRDNASPWNTHTKRMLRHKATIQAARLAFGYSGIYDEDEAQRIMEAQQLAASEERSASHQSRTEALKQRLANKPEPAPAPEPDVSADDAEFFDYGPDQDPAPEADHG